MLQNKDGCELLTAGRGSQAVIPRTTCRQQEPKQQEEQEINGSLEELGERLRVRAKEIKTEWNLARFSPWWSSKSRALES